MTQVEIMESVRDRAGGYKVDVTRGQRVGRVSSEWFSRPADERYLSLSELFAAVRSRTERSRTRTVESAAIRVKAARDDAERLELILPGAEAPVAPTHWSFGQLASLVSAPATYLRQLPAPLAGINLQYGLTAHRAEQVKTLEIDDGRIELRAVTGPDYGRIFDSELVAAVQRIAGNGTGDSRWKVPGVLDWSTGVYNPNVDISNDTTTLYASPRVGPTAARSRTSRSDPTGIATARRRPSSATTRFSPPCRSVWWRSPGQASPQTSATRPESSALPCGGSAPHRQSPAAGRKPRRSLCPDRSTAVFASPSRPAQRPLRRLAMGTAIATGADFRYRRGPS